MPGGSRQGCAEQRRIFEGLAKRNFGRHGVLSGNGCFMCIVSSTAIPWMLGGSPGMARPGTACNSTYLLQCRAALLEQATLDARWFRQPSRNVMVRPGVRNLLLG